MKDAYSIVSARLAAAGFNEPEPGCFISHRSARVIGLAIAPGKPEIWAQKTEDLLQRRTIHAALSWARYIVILVTDPRTQALAWSAAAFAQDVSKCRRIVMFVSQAEETDLTLPFLGLPTFETGIAAPNRDPEPLVRGQLPTKIADAFLDDDLPYIRVQELAEELE